MKDCKPTYKGIRYDNVNQIIDVIKQENFGNPFDSRGESFSSRQIKESVSEVFKMKPELSNIGSQEQYSKYLSTIFPSSQVKDIVYRADKGGLEKFTTKYSKSEFGFDSGIFFSTDTDYLNRVFKNEELYPAILNINNLKVVSEGLNKETSAKVFLPNDLNATDLPYWENLTEEEKEETFKEYENNKKNIDGIVGNDSDSVGEDLRDNIKGKEYVVYGAEQVHILGSKKDIEGFRNFIDKNIALSPRQENKPEKYQLFPGVYANKQQEEAIDNLKLFLSDDKQNSISLVGRGGTGKTTIIKKIVEDSNRTPYFIAPTHKAKNVLSQSTGAPANTLASALMIDLDLNTGKFKPNFFKRKMRLQRGLGETPISDYSLIIIDEGSMMNDEMFNEVMKLKDPSAKVIMMGDNVQLPPVGQESDSKMFDLDKSKLTERMRQGEESPIVPLTDIVAENVESEKPEIRVIKDRENKFDKESNQGVLFLKSEEAALEEFTKDYQNNPKSTKIITFNNQNNDSEQSVKNLNKKIRAKLQPDALNHLIKGDQLMAYSSTMLDGSAMNDNDDVQNSSEYTVENTGSPEEMNIMIMAKSKKLGVRSERLSFEGQLVVLRDNITGELLEEDHVIPTEKGKKQIADFKNKYAKKKDFQMLYKVDEKIPQMEFGYAINSHKAQGSTYRNVYVAEDNILSGSLRSAKVKNQSLYVAISRASDKVVIQSMKNPSDKIESTMEIGDKPADSDIQNQNISPIDYSELGDKVENYNVKIDTAKGRKPTVDKNEIVAYRGPNTKQLNNEEGLIKDLEENRMIGNPFGPYGLTKMSSNEKGEATVAFYNWLAGTEYQDKYQDYRQAILDKKNKMKSLDIFYYKDIGRPSHATALGYFLQQKDTPQGLETVSEDYGVSKSDKELSETETKKFIEVLKPQAESQTFKENRGRNANMMFHYGLRWGRTKGNPQMNVPPMKAPISNNPADKSNYYGYDLYDQNGNSLPPITDLQPIIDDIQNRTNIDMSNYDSVIGNIYLDGEYIYPHRDTTESKSAEKYPVVVYTIGNDAALGIWDDNKGKMTFANSYDSKYAPGTLKNNNPTNEVLTKNGTIYTFGLEGKGRFNLVHTTPDVTTKTEKYPPIKLPNGKTVTNYTITLTFRRAQNLEPGMSVSPTTPLPVGQTQKKPDLTPAEKYEKWLYGSIESQTDNEKAKREWIIDEVLDEDSELNQRIAKGQPIRGKGSHMPVLKQFIQDNSPLFTDRPKINDSMSIRQNIAQEDINNIEFNC